MARKRLDVPCHIATIRVYYNITWTKKMAGSFQSSDDGNP